MARAAKAGGLLPWTVAVVALLSGCTRGPIDRADSGSGDGSETAPAAEGAVDTGQLAVNLLRPTVTCDGAEREVAEISGARPGEPIVFSASVPIAIANAVADDAGIHRLVWSCDPGEARLRWELRAEGHLSTRAANFTLIGDAAELETTVDELTIDIPDQSVICDGRGGAIGSLSGASPNEQVNFSSPESPNIRPGTADEAGRLGLNWKCDPGDVGKTWNVTAVGTRSTRQGHFAITGVAPVPSEIEPLTVNVFEDPFVCDGASREFATLGNFAPLEVVDFSSAEADGLIDGRADGNGELTARWQCGLDDVGKTWRLTALGVDSQRTTTLTITGVQAADDATELTVSFTENPFGCDGASRVFATITNFVPGEFVDFSSPQSGPLRQGRADSSGNLPIRWQCGAADIDAIWDVTATGVTSARSTTFQITGASPPPG